MTRCLGIAVLATSALSAQTVGTAFRTLNLEPEEIVVEVMLSTPMDTLPEEAASMLAGVRITPRDLKSVGMLHDSPDRLGWQYCYTRPFLEFRNTMSELDRVRRQVREKGASMTFQFYFRASPKTVAAAKRKVLSEMLAEARASAGAQGKLRSVSIDPTPETLDMQRPAVVAGQASGTLQYNFSVVVVFE